MHTGSHKLNNALGQALLAQRMGKTRDHRRDRRRPARRRDGHRVRAARPRVRRLHGHRGHAPPAAQRRAHGAARRRRSCRVDAGRAHAQGGRLARRSATGSPTSATTPLRHRLGRRPGAVSGDRARPPARHRRRGARADAGARGPPARPRHRLRRRRLERDRHLHRLRRRRPSVELVGVEAAGEGHRDRPPRRAADRRRPRRRAARRLSRDHAGRRGPDPRGALDLAPASTTRAPGPSAPGCATPAARATRRSPTTRRSPRSASSRAWRGSSRRSRPRTRSPGVLANPPDRTRCDLVCLSGRGDKDLAEVLAPP